MSKTCALSCSPEPTTLSIVTFGYEAACCVWLSGCSSKGCDAVQVAPLRVRPADVADLQGLFVRGIAKSRGQGSLTLTPEAVLQLESYSFPGNIKVCGI